MGTKKAAVKKAAIKKKVVAEKVESTCFACDGTGETCNICGESQLGCDCGAMEVERHQEEYAMDQFEDCETCKGTGK